MTSVLPSFDPYWQGFLTFFSQKQITSNLTATVAFLVVVLVIRFIGRSWLKRMPNWNEPTSLVWRHRLRMVTWTLVTVVLLIIWAPQLRTFAVSLVAVAAALALALKEIISCMTGALVRSSLEGMDVGARIISGTTRGDIVRYDLLSTTLSEVDDAGQRTGHLLILPNSVFLSSTTIVEATADRSFATLIVTIPVQKDADWQKIETNLLEAAHQKATPEILARAKRYVSQFTRRTGFPLPSPEPRVYMDWVDHDKLLIRLRLVAPIADHHKWRQDIIRAVLTADHAV